MGSYTLARRYPSPAGLHVYTQGGGSALAQSRFLFYFSSPIFGGALWAVGTHAFHAPFSLAVAAALGGRPDAGWSFRPRDGAQWKYLSLIHI